MNSKIEYYDSKKSSLFVDRESKESSLAEIAEEMVSE
jgi:hypothetical protein